MSGTREEGGLPVDELVRALTEALRNVIPPPPPPGPPPTPPARRPDPVLSAPTAANRFNATARNAAEQTLLHISIPNWKRAGLKPVDLEKLRVNATKGLPNQFTLMSVCGSFVDGVELLKENIVATKLIDRVEEHCRSYGMDEVF